MTCLIRSKNKPLLDEYTSMLGSEDAAYYVLCMNNGYPLEFTPSGEKSDLFQKLLAKNNYDYEAAIEEKALMYYPSYYDTIGGDWTMMPLNSSVVDEKGEPRISYTPAKISFSDVFSQPFEITEMDVMQLPEIQKNLIENDLQEYLDKYKPVGLEERHNTTVKWLASRQKKLVDSINKDLIEAFGLEKHVDKDGNVTFVSKLKDELGRPQVIIQFCTYIENGKKGVYDLTGRIEAAANIIQISLMDGDPTTINHELAHHYVRMFWDSEVIQNAAKKLDDGDRSEGWKVRLEEKLVDELTKRTAEAEDIWGKFALMIRTAFLWITSPVKLQLLRKASLAFRLNDKARRIREDQYLLNFIDPNAKRVFHSPLNENIRDFDDYRSRYGLKQAMIKFQNDSYSFFKKYFETPDSILKDEYNEYVQHIKIILQDITIEDSEFNDIYIALIDAKENAIRTYPDMTSFQYAWAMNLADIANEVRNIRDSIKAASTGVATTVAEETTLDTDEMLKNVMRSIMRGLRTRIYEYLHMVPKSASQANKMNELVEKLNQLAKDIDKLVTFVTEGVIELRDLEILLEKHARNNYEDLNSQQLQAMYNAVEGFYIPVVGMIYQDALPLIIRDGILEEFGVKVGDMLKLCYATKSRIDAAAQAIAKRETHEYMTGKEGEETEGVIGDLLTDPQKERFLENFDDQLILGKLFEDINALQPHIGLASRSRSMVIRIARNMILSANAEIRKASIKDAAHIMKLYFAALPAMRKLGLKEVLSIFLEMDEKGLPTGYFVRKLNYGRFYRDLDTERDRLISIANEKLKSEFGDDAPQITYDSYNNPILPPDDDPKVKEILTEYADKLDDWLCVHSERMYTPDYYKKRREMLSPQTRKVMLDLQNRINAVKSKAPIVKVTDSTGNQSDVQATWELSPEDQLTLIQLENEYRLLGSHYYSDGTKKDGDQLKMAEEISVFNEWKSKQVKYVQNTARFDAAIEKIRERYGRDSVEEARFRKLNTSIKVDPEYYEWVLSRVRLIESPELDALRKRRNDLKKLIDEFDKKGIDVEEKRRQERYWESLKEIDAQIQELIESLNPGPAAPEERWDYYFDTEFVMYSEDETLLEHMLKLDFREYRRTHPADTRQYSDVRDELLRKYQYTYTFYDNDGNPHESTKLVSVFTRQVPKGASINKRRMKGSLLSKDVLITQYSHQFSDVDPESAIYNEHFDRNDTHLVQPKHDEYLNNKLWDLINSNSNIKALYDGLIELMERNNAKLPNNSDFRYKLPLISARRLTNIRRSGNAKEVFDALRYNFEMDWKLNERDDADINYEDVDDRLRANGTRINTIPVRYINMKDPQHITSDVVGSVIAFTEMANNFVVKTQLASQLEIVKQSLMDRKDAGLAKSRNLQSTHNTIRQLSNMMDDQLYANNTKLFNKENDFSKKELYMIKFFTRFLRLGRLLMLGWNFASMSLGFFESYIRGHIEAALGKDYTLRDLMHAYNNMLKYSLPLLLQSGTVQVKNKQVALMQWFGISKRLTESYHSTERNRFVKLMSENINGMFGFTMGDYANSQFQLSMALSNVRFIGPGNVEGVKAGFYTKLTLIVAIRKKNPELSYKQAKSKAMLLYKESGVCLEDAYDFNQVDGMVKVKDEYAPYVTKILENRVTGKCYQRLAEALGVVPAGDNPGYALYLFLRPLGILRNYIFTVIARNWNWAHDLQHRYIDPEGNVVKEDDMIDGYVDIDAGNMNIGLHQGLIGWMKMLRQHLPIIGKKYDSFKPTDESKELYNYAASKVGLEILSIVLLVGLSTLFKAMQKGDNDPDWWMRFGYLTSVRLVNSFISILDPTAFLEIIKNISTLISPLNDVLNLVTTLSDLVGLSGHSPFDEIKTGSYKGQTRLFRNIMRVTPFGNAYEDLAGPALKSRANWYIQQDPLTWSTIGGAYDQLWGIGN